MSTSPATYRFLAAELQTARRVLRVDGRDCQLGARAFDLLLALVERRDRVVPKNELLEIVWPRMVVEENNLPVQVSSLRKLLGPNAIATVPGRGYRFVAPLLEADDAGADASEDGGGASNDADAPRGLQLGSEKAIGRGGRRHSDFGRRRSGRGCDSAPAGPPA